MNNYNISNINNLINNSSIYITTNDNTYITLY